MIRHTSTVGNSSADKKTQRWSLPGFTLIELLVVVAIVGILAGLVTVNISAVRAKARDNRRTADLASVATALELFRATKKQYPIPDNAATLTDIQTLTSFLAPNYLSVIPSDPSFNRPPAYTFGHGYVYATNPATISGQPKSPGTTFVLDATLEQRSIDAPLDSLLSAVAIDSTAQDFFRTGYYQFPISGGKIHYRISR